MSELQTLARGLRILDLLSVTEDGLTATELSATLEVDKSSMSRLLSTLTKYGYAERDSQSRRYFLGSHLREIGRRAGQHVSLRELAEPLLQRLGDATGENAHLAVYADQQALTIADVPSTAPLRVVSEVGRRLPLHCSAIGKCLLAFVELPSPEPMPRYTERTITESAQLQLNLEQARLQGYALDDEELTLGVRGLAAPVRNREGRAIATMGLSGPAVRLTFDAIPALAQLLITTADEFSSLLGYNKDRAE